MECRPSDRPIAGACRRPFASHNWSHGRHAEIGRPRRRRAPELHEGRAGLRASSSASAASTSGSSTPASTTTRGQRRLLRRSCRCPAALQLGVGSGSHAEQTARALVELERRSSGLTPDSWSCPATSTGRSPPRSPRRSSSMPVCHLEAGLRSFDWTMPEEHNRRLTDHLSALLLTHSEDANDNLAPEGIADEADRLRRQHDDRHAARQRRARARARRVDATSASSRGGYILVTLHRPALVDDPRAARRTCEASSAIARSCRSSSPCTRGRARGSSRSCAAAASGSCRPALVHAVPLAPGRCGCGRHGLRRRAGGDNGARRPLLHAPGQHRAPGDGHARDEHRARALSRSA